MRRYYTILAILLSTFFVRCQKNTEFTDENVTPGNHWYYWQISQELTAPVLPGNLMTAHGHLAWSSPHFVDVE